MREEIQDYWRIGVPTDVVRHVQQTASSLIEETDSVTSLKLQKRLKEVEISTDDLSRIVEELAIKKVWGWTTDGTHRRYAPSPPPLSESERKSILIKLDLLLKTAILTRSSKM